MNRCCVAIVTTFLLAAATHAQSLPPRLPAEVRGAPGDFLQVKAETASKHVRWFAPDAGLKLFPTELLRDSKAAVVVSLLPGKYRLLAWTAVGDVPSEPAVCVVIVSDIGPAPGPNPPVPNPPDDPLAKALQAAYAMDVLPAKAAARDTLAEVYRQVADLANDATVPTAGELNRRLRETTAKLLGTNLQGVRDAVAEELRRVLPWKPDETLDAGRRAVAAQTFRRLAQLVGGLQ